MDFTTLKYIAFLGGVAILYRFLPARVRPWLLLIASYAFYWMWSGRMALLLLGCTAATYLTGRAIERATRENVKRALMLAPVAGLLAVLSFYKAVPLFRNQLHASLILPLGISYYTFKLISYVVDVYWGKIRAERAFIPFAAYASFFPQIVAGPIQRSESFLPQMHAARRERFRDVLLGMQRILLGYFKKFVVADNLALLVNYVYGHVHGAGTPFVLGFYAYPLQMYADFSALTDIAIGSAWLFGIESPENFNAPFSAVSPSEYWRRWHITLTTWLTDYVFTPLRMATREFGNLGLVFSLLVNMVLIGLWHGFRWSFVFFGLVHGIYLSVDALTARARRKYYKRHPKMDRWTNRIGPLVTFHLVAIAFVFFRGNNLGSIFFILGHLGSSLNFHAPEFAGFLAVSGRSILIGAVGYLILEALDYLRRRDERGELVAALPRWARWSVYSCTAVTALFAILVLLVSGGQSKPFLYAIF